MAELDALLEPLVAQAAPDLLTLSGVGTDTAGALLVAAGDNPSACAASGPSLTSAACHRSTRRQASSVTGSTAEGTAKPTLPCGESCSPVVLTRVASDSNKRSATSHDGARAG